MTRVSSQSSKPVRLESPRLSAAQRRARLEMLLEPGGEWLAENRIESAGAMLSVWLMVSSG